MAGMADAFFTPTADPGRFLATPHTEGLWNGGTQHAGPPSALLARAIELLPSSVDGPVQVARLTVEILGAVPVDDVQVAAAITRPGRSVELVEAELSGGGRRVMTARAWRVRNVAITAARRPEAGGFGRSSPRRAPGRTATFVGGTGRRPPPLPERPTVFADPLLRTGYLDAMEWRFVSGSLESTGPAQVWVRQRVPLVAGEEPTGLQRVVTVADSGNGLSRLFEFDAWWFINVELTVHLHRVPAGEWVYVDAVSTIDASGIGLAETELFDGNGPVGRGAQALLVGPRS
jgi:hypothetical protein